MKLILKSPTLILFISILFNICLKAQPGNYWSVSFNSEASLLAGAVVGGNSDITSIYYNPAGIAEIEDKKFAINANLFNLSYTNYKNALGTGLNLDYWGFTVQPRFVSFIFKLKKAEKLVWQFALFNHDDKRISTYDQIEKPVQLIHPNINENYIGNIDFVSDYTDSWGGFGVAYQVNEKLTIGGSILGSIKNFSYMKLINIDVHPVREDLPDTMDYYIGSSYSYEKVILYDVRLIGKFGIRYHQKQFSFGLNLSLPSVKLSGNSNVRRNISNKGIYLGGNSLEDMYLNESATFLESRFKDPLSFSFGFVFTNLSGRSSYYFTTEYFHKINSYKAIDGTKVISNKYEPASDFLSYKYGAKSIVNLAIGAKHYLSDKFEILFGFRTNFSPYLASNEGLFQYLNEFTETPANLYHFTGGSKFNYKQFSVIAGLEYTIGISRNISEFVNFAEPDVRTGNVLALAGDNNNNMDYIYNAFGLYFGLTIGF